MRIAPTTATPPTTGPTHPGPGASRKAPNMLSLLTKPSSGGTPAIDRAASPVSVAVTGMTRRRPVSFRMSRLPASRSTTPTSMNRVALNSACARVWAVAAAIAAGVPTPMIATRNPSWLTVE